MSDGCPITDMRTPDGKQIGWISQRFADGSVLVQWPSGERTIVRHYERIGNSSHAKVIEKP